MRIERLWTHALPAVLAATLVLAPAAAPPALWDGLEIQALAGRIAKEHGLKLSQPVSWSVMEREKLRARLYQLVAAEYEPEEIVDEGRLLTRLGLLPAGTAYDQIIYGLLEEQIMGLYDPRAKELVLLGGTSEAVMEGVLVHECTHAIQDMNFDLSALTERKPGTADRNAALEAVAEGDALLMEQVMTSILLPAGITVKQMKLLMQMAPMEGQAMAKAPGFLRSVLLFPYLYGYVLVRNVYAQGGYKAVNGLFESPPASTEQVIHPERLGQDPPIEVDLRLPSCLTAVYRLASEDVMGEFALSAWLEEWIVPHTARAAAEGWGGDRYAFLWPSSKKVGEGHLGHGVFVMMSTWDPGPEDDPDAEAVQFAAALVQYLEARHPAAGREEAPGGDVFGLEADQIAVVERRGRRVLFVEGLPSARADVVIEAAWASP
ncbi:MAG: hypothetical protein JRG91_00440 [Deltaproteobacteria bacterium]|nr:hypothetical protein [Deltaproteobacteria bacterium]